MEQQGESFHARVREGFLKEAARQPERIVVVSADHPIEEVQEAIRQVVSRRLGLGAFE
jgi:dTMP kinase